MDVKREDAAQWYREGMDFIRASIQHRHPHIIDVTYRSNWDSEPLGEYTLGGLRFELSRCRYTYDVGVKVVGFTETELALPVLPFEEVLANAVRDACYPYRTITDVRIEDDGGRTVLVIESAMRELGSM